MSDSQAFLRDATVSDMERIQGWFANAEQLFIWGGPGLVFGVALDEFCRQIKLSNLNSSVLTDGRELLGFGQFYVRQGRHHLGRLAISPEHRGKGLSKYLVRLLCQIAPHKQSANGFSLFVLPDNVKARSLYLKLGFVEQSYPEAIPGGLQDCIYMVCDNIHH
ncbi:MAG: GNAT family N-acetyltransferase [Aestuariibacter sp.]